MTNPYLADYTGLLLDWMHDTLSNDEVLFDLGVEAYLDFADTEDEVYIVYRVVNPPRPTLASLEGITTNATALIQIDVNGTTGYGPLRPVQKRLLELFGLRHNAPIPGGGHINECRYDGDVPMGPARVGDNNYYRIGAQYAVTLQAY